MISFKFRRIRRNEFVGAIVYCDNTTVDLGLLDRNEARNLRNILFDAVEELEHEMREAWPED